MLEEQRRPFHVSNLIDQRTSACTVKKSDERYLKNKTPSLYHFYWKLLSGFPFTHTMNMILKPVSYSQSEELFTRRIVAKRSTTPLIKGNIDKCILATDG